jgi:multiple sugar transport system permease protein
LRNKDAFWAYLFIAPQMLGLVLFIAGPVLFAIYLSFTQWNMIAPPRWVGLQNYWRQLSDPLFHTVV